MKKTLLIVSLVLALLLLTAGAALWAAGTRQEEDPMEKNVKLLMKAGDLDRDSAEGSVELLGELGVGELKKAEKLESRFGTTLRVTDRDGRVFYLMRPTKVPDIPVSLERNTEVFRHHFL